MGCVVLAKDEAVHEIGGLGEHRVTMDGIRQRAVPLLPTHWQLTCWM